MDESQPPCPLLFARKPKMIRPLKPEIQQAQASSNRNLQQQQW